MMLLIIGLLCICFAIGYAVNFLLLKHQNQQIFSKNSSILFDHWSCFSIMSLPFAGTGAPKAQADPSSEQLLKEQKQLASDISRLKEDKETLTASLEDVTKEKEKLSKKLENITSEKKTVKQQEKPSMSLKRK
ncbi:hypothetical protein OE903_22990 [Bacillus sp. B6(2022)]|nr:hypothetical protein [Bacillus sp. B6(2022)]